MEDQQLIDYIKKQLEAGFDEGKIYLYLLQLGYNREKVNEVLDIIHAEEEEKQRKAIEDKIVMPDNLNQFKSNPLPYVQHDSEVLLKRITRYLKTYKNQIILGIAIFILLILIINMTVWFINRPVCGNGDIEYGENYETCCVDAGCIGDMTCDSSTVKKGICINPVCGSCEYIDANHTCQKYECCSDEMCSSDQKCETNICTEILCSSCQYADKHRCNDYVCCNDADCDDNNQNTINRCINPSTIESRCSTDVPNSCFTSKDCDDNNPYTKDSCEGTPPVCVHEIINECINNDDFCPPGCVHSTDNDCEKCGNKIIGGNEQCDDGNSNNWDMCHNNCSYNLNHTIISTELAFGRLSHVLFTFDSFEKVSIFFSADKFENKRNMTIALFEGMIDKHNIYAGININEGESIHELFFETDSPEKYELTAELPFEQLRNRTWLNKTIRYGIYVPYQIKTESNYSLVLEKQKESATETEYKCVFTDLKNMKPQWCGSISVKYPLEGFSSKGASSSYITGMKWSKEMKFADLSSLDYSIIIKTDDNKMPIRATSIYSNPEYGDIIPMQDISYDNSDKSIHFKTGVDVPRINSPKMIY